jgi:site-specific recombinase XerD
LHARRPKTGTVLMLPLLPPVAKALAVYIQQARPPHVSVREIFITPAMPHTALSTSALRHQVRVYARAAGVEDSVIGAHVFRHSHATRQFDVGAHPKVVGDILGHRSPSSTSLYVRVALRRLRSVALPVPR